MTPFYASSSLPYKILISEMNLTSLFSLSSSRRGSKFFMFSAWMLALKLAVMMEDDDDPAEAFMLLLSVISTVWSFKDSFFANIMLLLSFKTDSIFCKLIPSFTASYTLLIKDLDFSCKALLLVGGCTSYY